MKALKCEMCSGNDFVKQDGLYVCQFCGTKYTADEARKLMIEGEVEVKGVMTAEKLAQNGETLLTLGRYADAKNVFHRLSCDYPEDYRGWWGMARAESETGDTGTELEEHISAALTVAPDEVKNTLEEDCRKLLKKHGKKLKTKGSGNSKALMRTFFIVFIVLTAAAAVITARFGIGTGTACVDAYKNGFDFDWFKPSLMTVLSLAATLLFGLIANIFKKKLR